MNGRYCVHSAPTSSSYGRFAIPAGKTFCPFQTLCAVESFKQMRIWLFDKFLSTCAMTQLWIKVKELTGLAWAWSLALRPNITHPRKEVTNCGPGHHFSSDFSEDFFLSFSFEAFCARSKHVKFRRVCVSHLSYLGILRGCVRPAAQRAARGADQHALTHAVLEQGRVRTYHVSRLPRLFFE